MQKGRLGAPFAWELPPQGVPLQAYFFGARPPDLMQSSMLAKGVKFFVCG